MSPEPRNPKPDSTPGNATKPRPMQDFVARREGPVAFLPFAAARPDLCSFR